MSVRILSASRALGVLVLLGGCAAKLVPYPALRIPANAFEQQVHTICLQTVRIPRGLPETQAKADAFEVMLTSELTAAGFTVVPTQRTEEVWKQVNTQHGGYYDAYTGWRNEERYQRIRKDGYAQLHAQLGCDAQLAPAIVLVNAGFDNGEARWDGTTQFVGGKWGSAGHVRAISLWVTLTDTQGERIYFSTGGIQVLAHTETDFLFFDHVETESLDNILTDPQKNLNAVKLSLAEMVHPPPVVGQ